jgi:hypothetical protein
MTTCKIVLMFSVQLKLLSVHYFLSVPSMVPKTLLSGTLAVECQLSGDPTWKGL